MKPESLLIVLLLSYVGHAGAHDLWIERQGLKHSLSYGHERSAHAGEKLLEYAPEQVNAADCFNADGHRLQAKRTQRYPVTLEADCAASWFALSSGYWSKTPYGTKNVAKTEATAVITSWLSIEGVKRIDRWSPTLARPLSASLELSPNDNPLRLKAGDKLRLRAWFANKPAPGVTVAYFGKPRGITDAEGYINVRLVNPGFQLLQASLEVPLNDARADKTIHSSNLQFELP